MALTCFALIAATVGLKTGNRAYANNMFRLRGMYNEFLDTQEVILSMQRAYTSCRAGFHGAGDGWRFAILLVQRKGKSKIIIAVIHVLLLQHVPSLFSIPHLNISQG